MKIQPDQKTIKLGQIKNCKLEKFTNSVVWELHETIAIFLRDALRKFADTTHSYPDRYNENWEIMTTEQWENRDKEKDGYKIWINHIREIADKIDFYLKDTEDLLDQEDKDFLEYYHKKYPMKFEKLENGNYTLVDYAPQEDKDKYHNIIYNKESTIGQNQLKAMQEALHDIAKIFPDLWD